MNTSPPVLNAPPLGLTSEDLNWGSYHTHGAMGPSMEQTKCDMYMDTPEHKPDPNMNNINSFNNPMDSQCSMGPNTDLVPLNTTSSSSCTSSTGPGGMGGSSCKELCCGCGRPIEDRYLLRVMDNSWHEHCLQCSVCRHPLTQSCFVKDSKLLCKADYDRYYGAKCYGCLESIPPNELVMRALGNVYHVRCFLCVACRQQLRKGDQFVLKDGQIFCRLDFEKEYMHTMHMYGTHDHMDWGAPYSPKSDGDSLLDENDGDQPKGPKRPRTILTTSQRRKFKSSFEINPKPCRKVREALAAETGLSVRVVQVWFQNQRAKMKKIARKQQNKEQNGDKDGKNAKKSNKKKEDGDSDSESIQNDSACSVGQSDSGLFDNSSSLHTKLDSLEDVFMNQATGGGTQGSSSGAPGQQQQQGPIVNPIDKLYSMQSSYFNSE